MAEHNDRGSPIAIVTLTAPSMGDSEVTAMALIAQAMNIIHDVDARQRVAKWVADRWDVTTVDEGK